MNNQYELLKALVDGKKLRNKHWNTGNHYVQMKHFQIVDEANKKYIICSSEYEDWEVYIEKISAIIQWRKIAESNSVVPCGDVDWESLVNRETKMTLEFVDDK